MENIYEAGLVRHKALQQKTVKPGVVKLRKPAGHGGVPVFSIMFMNLI
jgi:hypothetical protein